MRCRLILAGLLLCFSAACSRHPEPPAAVTASEAAPTPAPDAAPATPAPEALPAATSADVLRDTDYTVIPGGKPYDAIKGKIEVVEFFNYICPACNAFDPLLQQWKATLPSDVNLVYVPADFRDDFAGYARVYYAADLLGVEAKTHQAVFQAIHQEHKLPGEGDVQNPQRIAHFYEAYGVSAGAFTDAMESFAVNTKLDQGHKFEIQCQVESTPSLVVNGKYLVKGRTFVDMVRIAGQLVERERSNQKS